MAAAAAAAGFFGGILIPELVHMGGGSYAGLVSVYGLKKFETEQLDILCTPANSCIPVDELLYSAWFVPAYGVSVLGLFSGGNSAFGFCAAPGVRRFSSVSVLSASSMADLPVCVCT